MRAWLKRKLVFPTLLLPLAVASCNRQEAPPAPVHGRVFYKGVPLVGGSIVFAPNPEKGGQGPLARADIQGDGSYVLQSGDRPGAVPGWHRVSVVCVETPPGQQFSGRFPEVRALVPLRYSVPEMSGLEGHVLPKQDNAIDFHLD